MHINTFSCLKQNPSKYSITLYAVKPTKFKHFKTILIRKTIQCNMGGGAEWCNG